MVQSVVLVMFFTGRISGPKFGETGVWRQNLQKPLILPNGARNLRIAPFSTR
jgi:hypothetical protein